MHWNFFALRAHSPPNCFVQKNHVCVFRLSLYLLPSNLDIYSFFSCTTYVYIISAGFIIGLVLSGIIMGLLSSAVDSIIVCFAEAPTEFMDSHPALAQEMQTAWSAAWPEEFRGVAIVSLGGGLGIV